MVKPHTPFGHSAALNWLEVASQHRVMLIRICGIGNMHLALTLKDFVSHSLSLGFQHFLLDFDLCTGLDSTFMGTLLRLSEELKSPSLRFELFNINSNCERLLTTLGVSAFLTICGHAKQPELSMTQIISTHDKPAERLELIKVTHQRLTELSEENRVRFGTFLKLLEDEGQ